MKKLFTLLVALFFCSLLPQMGFGQDLIYKPVNPAFGGDTFNYNWLLSSAQAQDLTEDTRTRSTANDRNTLDDFTESLNRQLLSQLSRQLVSAQFGEAGLEEGNYTIGNYQIDVTSTLDGLSITVLDSSVGDQTQIIIPYY